LYFDGVDDYVYIGEVLRTFPRTLIVMFNAMGKLGYQVVVGKNFGGIGESVLQFDASFPQRMRFYYFDGTATRYLGAANTLFNALSWYHVAVIFDPTLSMVYVNGVLDNQFVPAYPMTYHPSARFQVGSRYPDNVAQFQGYVAQVLIYSRALSDEEIRWNYMYPDNPVRNGLVLWLHWDSIDVERGIWYDRSGFGNHGTIYGAALVQIVKQPRRTLSPARILAPVR